MSTTTNLSTLKINYLTQAQYETALVNNQINEDELYFTPDSGIDTAGTGLSKSGTTLNHTNSVTAQTTQAVYPIKIDAQGHISAYGNAVAIPTKVSDLTNDAGYTTNTGTVTGVTAGTGLNTTSNDTTTDGGTISSSGTIYLTKSGATAGSYGDSAAQTPGYGSTFKVPYITVDKYGRVTSISEHTVKIPASDNTNTTYTLTNALSSHKFTETLTAGGSGSGTSTATMEFVAGTGITLTDDTTNKKITIACSVTNTDEKLKTVALTNSTTYYPILATGANSAANRQVDSDTGGFKYISVAGTTSLNGTAILSLGNEIVSGTANNELGVLRLYDSTAYYIEIRPESGSLTANRAIYLPSYAGTMYFTCTDTTNSVGGATTAPVYVDNTGRIQAVTSIPYSLLTSTPTIPSITLNGSSSTSPSFYAPTSAGTSGYVLKSNGSGAPSWISATLTDQNVKTSVVTAATTIYLAGSTSSTATTSDLLKHASAAFYVTANSETSGYTQLRLGNTTATSSAGGKEGQIRLYGTTATYYVTLKAGAPSENRTITFPNATGTVALTSDIPTVPTITLNGSSTTSASFYAPTTAGTSGYYLQSNGSGAPTWASITAGVQNLVDGSATGSLRGVGSQAETSSYTLGQYAVAIGHGTYATGYYSHAEGNYTKASGNCAHAEGYGDDDYVIAAGEASHAEGIDTLASGDYSHAEGNYTEAFGYGAHAEGLSTQAIGYYSHSGGSFTRAKGLRSFVHGAGPKAYSSLSSAVDTTVYDNFYNTIYGTSGYYAVAPTEYSSSDPRYGSIALGDYSIATGSCTLAYGYASHAEGCSTIAKGSRAHAQNCSTQANGDRSSAAGWGTIAGSNDQFVIGRWNTSDTSNAYAFIVGNGTGASGSGSSITYNRANAFTISWTGDVVAKGGLEVASIDHTITAAEYADLMTDLDALS